MVSWARARLAAAALCLWPALALAETPPALDPETFTIDQAAPWGGTASREYHLLMPPNMAADEYVPMVVVLHDAGDDALAGVYRQGWIATASQAKFAILAPEAGGQRGDRRFGGFFNGRVWNAGSPGAANWADGAFLSAAVADALKRRQVDQGRVYVVGFGEGGAMAQRLIADGATEFAAAASVAGALYAQPMRAAPRPLYLLFGLSDPTNPVGGGGVYTPWAGAGEQPALASQTSAWVKALGCDAGAAKQSAEGDVIRQIWPRCSAPASLMAVFVRGLGRQWPGVGRGVMPARVTGPANDAIFAPWDIWRFLEARRNPKS